MGGKRVFSLVVKIIEQNNVVIFSKTYCPHCQLAKDVFTKLQKDYTVVELDQRRDGSDIQEVLGEITGAYTVPRVFVKGKCLGGASDVKSLYESGQLNRFFKHDQNHSGKQPRN